MIKIFNLNLWRYNDFENRLTNLVKSVDNLQPDVIFLQEAQLDTRFSFLTQVELIKNQLNMNYRYTFHSTVYKKKHQKGEKLDTPIDHGMGILSKYPILNCFEYYLNHEDSDLEPRSVLFFELEKDNVIHKFINIHFTNKEEIAQTELGEIFQLLKDRNEDRIMVGDFNMFNLSDYLKGNDRYTLSYDFKQYISYKKDEGTLDYILIPKNYHFEKFECLEEYMSDHNAIFAQINKRE